MMRVYGIKNCDTCRKARQWLDQAGRDYAWQDLRDDPPAKSELDRWVGAVGVDRLVNRRSTTWRGLDENERARALDPSTASGLLAQHPTLIKRPVIELDDRVLVGFNESVKQAL